MSEKSINVNETKNMSELKFRCSNDPSMTTLTSWMSNMT